MYQISFKSEKFCGQTDRRMDIGSFIKLTQRDELRES